MNKKLLRSEIDILRWETIFGLLSMDQIEPFISDMGLNLNKIGSIRNAARYFIKEYEGLQEMYHRFSDEQAYVEQELLMKQTFTKISSEAGEEITNYLYEWGINNFPWEGNEAAKERAWSLLLLWMAGLTQREDRPTPPNLRSPKLNSVIQLIDEGLGDYSDLDEQISRMEKLPRSAWDKRIYNSYIEGTSPLTSVRLVIDYHRVHRVWDQIIQILSSDELEVLMDWAKSQAPGLGISPDWLERLDLN